MADSSKILIPRQSSHHRKTALPSCRQILPILEMDPHFFGPDPGVFLFSLSFPRLPDTMRSPNGALFSPFFPPTVFCV
jgi:hypothetical protein